MKLWNIKFIDVLDSTRKCITLGASSIKEALLQAEEFFVWAYPHKKEFIIYQIKDITNCTA